MKNKKLLFFAILLFPALLKIILDFTTINTRKLPYYGPKEVLTGKDTVFYKVSAVFKTLPSDTNKNASLPTYQLDTIRFPLYAVCFIKQSYKKDNYRMAGLSEYAQYKRDKIKQIPFVIVTPCSGLKDTSCLRDMKKLEVGNDHILNLFWNPSSFDSLNATFFKEKPIYIDYSFFVLVDKQRHVRGYYDGRYVSEIKRLIEEYQHLRLKEEKQSLINNNKIESK